MTPDLFLKKVNNKLFHTDDKKYKAWFLSHRVTEDALKTQRETVFEKMPLVSVLVPIYKTPIPFLNEMIESVVAQSYGNWELILANASPEEAELQSALKAWAEKDARIVLFDLEKNGGISENTCCAFEKAKGEFVALFDHDDLLTPDALFEYVKAVNENPNVQFLYCDEDKVTEDSEYYFFPNFKPDFNFDMLMSNNYICHFLVVRRELAAKAGQWRKEYDGAQDFDFILRLLDHVSSDEKGAIVHIPKILYHWRSHAASTAKSQSTKGYASSAGERAVSDYLSRNHIAGTVSPSVQAGWYSVCYEKEADAEFSEIVFDGDDTEAALTELSEKLAKMDSPYVLIRRAGTAPLSKEQADVLLGDLRQPSISAVSPKILRENRTVFYAGASVKTSGEILPFFSKYPEEEPGFMCRAITCSTVSVLALDCMAVRREDFVNGTWKRLKYHPEVVTTTKEKAPLFFKELSSESDPYYNRNFSERKPFEVE